jgi:hypothetical protein
LHRSHVWARPEGDEVRRIQVSNEAKILAIGLHGIMPGIKFKPLESKFSPQIDRWAERIIATARKHEEPSQPGG